MDDQWTPLDISEIRMLFASVSIPWWIAGGVAIDLFLGWETRSHDDIDIEMFRSDNDALFDVFVGWDLELVSGGEMAPFVRGEELAQDVYGVWGRPNGDDRWAVEVIFADGDVEEWQFRRDNSITLQGGQLLKHTSDGTPYCAPEVQLLYKSKVARPKDDVDFARCLHRMTGAQRDWLASAVARSEPGHPWVVALHAANSGSMNEA